MATELVGRADEVAAGHRFLDSVRTGPASLVIEGEPGIGKTALLNAIVVEATAASTLTLRSRPAEPEADLALASLGDLLAPVAEAVRPALPDPQRRALDTALVLADPEPSAQSSDPRAVGAMLLSALRSLAASRPVVVAIDDAQWVDAASARAIGFAARRLSDERVGFLVAVRTGEAAAFEVTRAPAQASSETVMLGPMSLGALHRLIESQTGISLSRPALVSLERASRGIPLFALDMIDAAIRSGSPITPDTILTAPSEIDRIVEPRLDALPDASRRLVVAVSALARPTLESLGHLARRRDLRPVLAPATEAGLIEVEGQRVRFVHPLYRSAVYRAESPERRRALHRRLASVVSDPDEAAHHLAVSADQPDAVVATAVTSAARDAQARGALDAASWLLEHAIRLVPTDARGQRADLMLALARCCWELGDVDRSSTLADEVIGGDPPDEARAAALVLRGMHALWTRGATEAIGIYEAALRFARSDRILEATIHLRIAYAADSDLCVRKARHPYAGRVGDMGSISGS